MEEDPADFDARVQEQLAAIDAESDEEEIDEVDEPEAPEEEEDVEMQGSEQQEESKSEEKEEDIVVEENNGEEIHLQLVDATQRSAFEPGADEEPIL